VIQAAKEKVATIDLADRLSGPGQMRRVGAEWVTNCRIPDHHDRVPSFTVNPEKNLWFCHGCVRGGDVVKLAALVWGIDRADVAAAELLIEFGHEIPARPDAWYAKGKRQAPVRDAIEQAKKRRVQRRLYRWLLAPALANIEDPDERAEEAAIAWADAGFIAHILVCNARDAA